MPDPQIKELVHELEKLNAHFTNGFRAELKQHVSDSLQEVEIMVHQIARSVNRISSPWFWIKTICTIVGILAPVVGGILAVIALI